MTALAPSIAILGGGTAGWMAACLFAEAWPAARVTVIEAPEIPTVGVGEGSTPQLAALLRRLGLTEREWMPRANATYKAGIRFTGWSRAPGFESYVHPFASGVDPLTESAFHHSARIRRTGGDVPGHPDRFFLNSRLIAARRSPLAPDSFPFEPTYGFHFDAQLIGAVLREAAVARGVIHLPRRVQEVEVALTGDVSRLLLQDNDAIAADIFVDASGFRSVIAGAALGVRFLPFGENLFCDRAVAIPSPAAPAGPDVHTSATALSSGWAWAIPLTGRTGNGYVYSSAYLDREGAEAELRRHLGEATADARHLDMRVGRVERSWAGNCLSIGLAQGFVEPLEATALHLVQATVEQFIEAWGQGGGSPAHRDRFNAAVARRYEGIRDYIVAHYRLNTRTDTAFWRDNAAHDHLSASLKRLMTCWFTGGDLVAEIAAQGIGDIYAPLSWGCLFAGYGTFPPAERLGLVPPPVDLPAIERMLDRCLLNFPADGAALGQPTVST